MVRKALIGITLLGLIGCAKITYKDDEFTYSRWGKQSLEGFEAEKVGNTIKVKIGKQSGDSGKLAEALKDISKIATGAVIPTP